MKEIGAAKAAPTDLNMRFLFFHEDVGRTCTAVGSNLAAGVAQIVGTNLQSGAADGINIIVAVIVVSVNTISTGTVNQTGVVGNSSVPVMVGPGIEHIHIGIAQTGVDVLGDGIQTAKVVGTDCRPLRAAYRR